MVAGSVLYGDPLRARFLPPSAPQLRVGALEQTLGTTAGSKTLAERVAALEQAAGTMDRRIADAVSTGNRVAAPWPFANCARPWTGPAPLPAT